MGILASIFPSLLASGLTSNQAVSATNSAIELVDTLFTSDDERLDKQAVLARIALKADELQTKVNMTEATHRSVFVAGWRPFIGWVCGMALGWHFLLQPSIAYILAHMGHGIVAASPFDLTQLQTILFGILGLGTLRSAEKAVGKAR